MPSITIGYKDDMPLNAPSLCIYSFEEFKVEFSNFIKKSNLNDLLKINHEDLSNNTELNIYNEGNLKSCIDLDENINHFEKGIYKKDLLIDKMKEVLKESYNSKGLISIISYSLFSSIIIQLNDNFKKLVFKILNRYQKRQLKFNNMNTIRLSEELICNSQTQDLK